MERLTSLSCLWIFFLLFASISFEYCSAINTIAIAQPLEYPNYIVSSGGAFKLGFFSPQNTTNRYVGIMFNVPSVEAVWVANRDRPLNDSSGVLTISKDGNLVVLNGKKEILWSSNAPNPVANSTAQLLENGNLVLTDSYNGRSVWQSFEHPTDSFFAGMRIGGSGNGTIQLTSWRSPFDPSTGTITFGLNSTRIPEVYLLKRGVLFWRSGPWDGRAFIGAPTRRSRVYGSRFNMIIDNAGETYFTYENRNSTNFSHFKVSELGDIEEFVINEEGEWLVAFPSKRTECDVYGKCGPNGICDQKGSPICTCLRGFKPRNPDEWSIGNWSGGCLMGLQQCDGSNNSSGKQIEDNVFMKLSYVKLPDFYNVIHTPEDECGDKCLKNCSCSAYAYVDGIGCLYRTDNMIDIQQFSMLGSDFILRLAHSELDYAKSNKRKKAIVSTTVSLSFTFLATSSFFFWKWWNKHQGKEHKTDSILNESLEKSKLEVLQMFVYHNLVNATDNFHASNKLGQGSFGGIA